MIETAPTATKRHVMIGIAPKFEIKQIYFHSVAFRKEKGTNGVPDQKCIICGFSLQNHITIDVLEGKGKKHTIHKAHIDD